MCLQLLRIYYAHSFGQHKQMYWQETAESVSEKKTGIICFITDVLFVVNSYFSHLVYSSLLSKGICSFYVMNIKVICVTSRERKCGTYTLWRRKYV